MTTRHKTESIASACARYLADLRLTPEARSALIASAGTKTERSAAMTELHRGLAGCEATRDGADNPAYASVGQRLRLAYGNPAADNEPIFTRDRQGRVQMVTTPPLARASMLPQPWSNNPLKRLWRWMRGALFGRRGRLTTREPATPAPAPNIRWKGAGRRRRSTLLLLVLAQTWVASYYMTAVLPYHGTTILEITEMVLYAILFAWISAGFWTAMMGFWSLLLGRDRYSVTAGVDMGTTIPDGARTAILMPICNEDVTRVYAGLRATYDSVVASGELRHFDFFVLSDSGDPDARVAELDAWRRLCETVGGYGRIYYRRRRHRIKRKSGNIGDWCRRWGSRYRYMVILDADSVMSGECLTQLVRSMEAHPNAGIIQTAPRAAGRDTLYARIQQFATRVYGPLFTAGLHFWQLGESHYWGHNAIIRVAPFIRHCALGRLPGRGALAGEILSHDFVEAALMRRAGWAVWIAYDLAGSYEEMPPNLLDELKRDRRWCQGNLMNFRLFLTKGLHPAHRAVFMTGVMAYLSAPLWFLFLVLSTALLVIQKLTPPRYFVQPYQLFPLWPEWHPGWALALFSATATLLFLPKILAVVLILAKGARSYGGRLRLTVGMIVELGFSALLAPVRMLFHTQFVVAALLGVTIQWKSPSRDDAQTSWSEAIGRHGLGTLLGVVWAAGVYWVDPAYLWWLAPIVGALIAAIPISVWSSGVRLGERLRRAGLFLIPEESAPPLELQETATHAAAGKPVAGFMAAVADPAINAVACASGRARNRRPQATRDDRVRILDVALTAGPDALNTRDRDILLGDPLALSRLHFSMWAADDVAVRRECHNEPMSIQDGAVTGATATHP